MYLNNFGHNSTLPKKIKQAFLPFQYYLRKIPSKYASMKELNSIKPQNLFV